MAFIVPGLTSGPIRDFPYIPDILSWVIWILPRMWHQLIRKTCLEPDVVMASHYKNTYIHNVSIPQLEQVLQWFFYYLWLLKEPLKGKWIMWLVRRRAKVKKSKVATNRSVWNINVLKVTFLLHLADICCVIMLAHCSASGSWAHNYM